MCCQPVQDCLPCPRRCPQAVWPTLPCILSAVTSFYLGKLVTRCFRTAVVYRLHRSFHWCCCTAPPSAHPQTSAASCRLAQQSGQQCSNPAPTAAWCCALAMTPQRSNWAFPASDALQSGCPVTLVGGSTADQHTSSNVGPGGSRSSSTVAAGGL
jgi:hypothetical protein